MISLKKLIEYIQALNLRCHIQKSTVNIINVLVLKKVIFFYTLLCLKEDKIIVDLYKKPTDRNLYLLPTSCHPPQMITNIPYSLALRIVRICSESDTRDKRLNELRDLLCERNYSLSVINSAILRAKKISRSQALYNLAPSKSNVRPVYVITYDPRLPNIQSIVNKHWRSMKTVDPYLATVFPEPPLIALKKRETLRISSFDLK